MSVKTVLIADDDSAIRTVLNQAFARAGYAPRATGNAATLWRWVAQGEGDVIITDVVMPDENAFDLIPRIKKLRPELPIIVMSAQNTLMTALTAAEKGVFEYLPKPFDLNQIIGVVGRALAEPGRRKERATPDPGEAEELPLIGRSPAMQEIYRVLARLTRTDLTVMITGESGTGKELVARALHEHSPRATRPFIALNTAAIPADLLESELFGHERGAFTGADAQRRGRFEQADGGTLFLDEISDMSLPLQTRLLRVLAEGEFYRVGGQTPIRVDVRVIAASHQNLQERVTGGLFREDLYHRLNVIRIELPPLRARAEDIPDLLGYYLVVSAQELGVDAKSLAPEALARLAAYDWPGNVRELVNLCRRLSVLAPGSEVHLADLPPELAAMPEVAAQADWATALGRWAERHALAGEPPLLDTAQPQFERVLIRAALKRTQGHRQEAARLLGWGRNTLTRKLRDLGMTGADGGDE